jgi:hypothetical protein
VLSLNSIHVFALRMQCVMLPVEVQHYQPLGLFWGEQSDMYNPLKTAFTICVSYQIIEFCLYVFMCGLCNLLNSEFLFWPYGLVGWLILCVCVSKIRTRVLTQGDSIAWAGTLQSLISGNTLVASSLMLSIYGMWLKDLIMLSVTQTACNQVIGWYCRINYRGCGKN